ncbi:MAG: hypothetical protein J5J00_13380 [Deltaproteobacteria bacterium]|nr:hypothetical protein [Deltaproteobacteria bacterium]
MIIKVLPLALLVFSGCAELNDPYYSGPYRDPYGRDDYYRDDYYRDREREIRRDKWELERERRRAEEERRRLERERERQQNEAWRRPPPPPAQDRCPPGFSPSEQKCTPQERKKGCKDIRLPSGLGCVRR